VTPPGMLDETAPFGPTVPASPEQESADDLRTELVHRHLHARLRVAGEQIQILEDHSPAPEILVRHFAATIQDAQRVLDAARAEATAHADARRQAAEVRAAELLDRARAEAAAMREVAARLRGGDRPTDATGRPEPTLDLRAVRAPAIW